MAARLGSPRKPRKTTPSAPPRDVGPGDNSKAIEEAERVQLISFIAKHEQAEADVAKTKAPYDEAKKRRSTLRALIKASGIIPMEEFDQRRREMEKKTGENAETEAREKRHRRWLGIISPEQAEMHLGGSTPEEARDEADWESEGYKIGLRGLQASPPDGMPPRFMQAFLKGHGAGFKSSLESLAERAPKPKGMTAAQVADQAKKDFEDDNPEVDIAAAARKLKNDPKFMARGGGEETVEAGGVAPPVIVGEPAPDAFEASETELQGQSTRRAVQEQKAAGENEEEIV